MALSNIRREPRRELTETTVGLMVFVVPLYLDYRFALWFNEFTGKDGCPIPIGMFLGPAALCLLFGLLGLIFMAIHSVGESVCNNLAEHGLELRPKDRR